MIFFFFLHNARHFLWLPLHKKNITKKTEKKYFEGTTIFFIEGSINTNRTEKLYRDYMIISLPLKILYTFFYYIKNNNYTLLTQNKMFYLFLNK